jgi:hypothetical protein
MMKNQEPLLPWTPLSTVAATFAAVVAFAITRYLQSTNVIVRIPAADVLFASATGVTVLKRLNPGRRIVMMFVLFLPALIALLAICSLAESWYFYNERL